MGLFRPRRSGRASRWLEWKVRIFAVGAVLGLAGIFLDDRILVIAALVVLAVGAGLRLLPEEKEPRERGEVDDQETPDDADVERDEHSTL
ncbi:MAG: hypothetical protein LJF04_10495 [Gemmatimonadetes bacterium]|nr:hypothetical protein [Gemmatimonadota bacterium]